MKAIRAYFLSRLPREKILVTSLIFLGAAVWLIILAGQARTFWGTYSRYRTQLNRQAATIARSPDVDARSEAAVAILVPSQTLNAQRLFAEVQRMAREAPLGMNPSVVQDGTQPSGQFSVHTVRLTANQIADWSAITRFALSLNQRAPYMKLRTWQISVAGNPAQHSLQATISSVERPQ